jgi:hypothetical protein
MNLHEIVPTANTDAVARVAAAMADCHTAQVGAYAMPYRTDGENVARCLRLALICARMSAWWGVLADHVYRDPSPATRLFGQALILAQHAERDRAKFWRESADEWLARAERRPTSDAAGSLSNWDELGVTA